MKSKMLAKTMPLVVMALTGMTVCGLSARPGSAAPKLRGIDPPVVVAAMAPLFTPSVQTWEEKIIRWSESYGLDPNLAATVMQIESCGNPHAVSPSGAQGLFQVMPFHFPPGEDMQDPEINAQRGLVYLAESLIKSEGDIRRALAGYNGGHGVIDWDPAQWPAETRRYAYWGEGIYTDAAAGRSTSPRLEEWLEAGGAWLCEKASKQMGV